MLKQPRSLVLSVFVALAICSGALGQQEGRATGAASARIQPAETKLDGYVRNFQFVELAQALAEIKPSVERDYFDGILANREGRLDDSVAMLDKAVPAMRKSNPRRAGIGLHALADDYVKLFRYNDAIRTYQDLLDHFAESLDKAERQSTRDDYAAATLLKDVPAQTISFNGPIDIQTHRDPVLDTIDADLTVNGVTESWILDTGANFSTVSASFARKLGVHLAQGTAQTQGITGAENRLHIGILPELKLGSATVHNVVLLVLEDSSLNVPSGKTSRYQINAVLGYPVLQALERVTFTKDGHFLAGPASPAISNGAPLYMNLLTPLLQCSVDGQDVLFSFDTGANRSFFSVRYRREFASQLNGLEKKPYGMRGAGGARKLPAYYLPQAHLGIGATMATLKDVPVLPALGTDSDKLFGNLGRDLTDPYRSFTIDFKNMRFALGEKNP